MANPVEPARLTADASGRLTLRGLRVFIALEEARSLGEAAKFLNLSKSNVSQHITALEASIGTRLFDRQQKPVTLTPAGQVLSLHAHRILAMVSVAEASLAELSLAGLPQLNFGIIDDLDTSLTPVLAASLQSQMPKCFIRTFSGRSDQVTARLAARETDIAVTASIPVDMHRFHVVPLLREKFVLVTAKGSYTRGGDWRAQLSELPFVQYSEAMPMGQLVATHLKRIGFHPSRKFSFETSRSVIATVAKTGGWTLTTPLSILDTLRFRDQIDICPLPFAGVSRQIYLISRMDELGSLPDLLAKQFRQLLQEEVVPDFEAAAPDLIDALEVSGDALL
ncbi:LysR family transcriptional regulator [Albirhodobacter sp. R86504]|jgi:DNA-binding transcriptional LysR family regulator|uniref:LysR family transcriptional regulator n=1 Tax=Albirhodobacter sp. R86504 TaxID=3093848 RepID=UPI0036724CF8